MPENGRPGTDPSTRSLVRALSCPLAAAVLVALALFDAWRADVRGQDLLATCIAAGAAVVMGIAVLAERVARVPSRPRVGDRRRMAGRPLFLP